jgi:hypothetical protein
MDLEELALQALMLDYSVDEAEPAVG